MWSNPEYSHFLDHLSGKEHNAWNASDIPGTLENEIAVKFRSHMIPAKGDYWSRTCECFARAVEEYAHISLLREKEISKEAINEKISKSAFVEYETFQKEIEPLINTLLEQYKERFVVENTKVKERVKNHENEIMENKENYKEKEQETGKNSYKEDMKFEGKSFNNNYYTQLELFEPAAEYNKKEFLFFNDLQKIYEKEINWIESGISLQSISPLLVYAGLKEQEINLQGKIIQQAKDTNKIDENIIIQSLQSLADPVMVFGDDLDNENRHLIVTDTIIDGRPVAVSLVNDKSKT